MNPGLARERSSRQMGPHQEEVDAHAFPASNGIGVFALKESVLMNQVTHEALHLTSEELAILSELLETAHTSLLVEIRHTDHRSYRDELRSRLRSVEHLIRLCRPQPHTEPHCYEHAPDACGG